MLISACNHKRWIVHVMLPWSANFFVYHDFFWFVAFLDLGT